MNSFVKERCAQHAPKGYGWTSVQINVGTESAWHVDHRNLGPSCLAILGRDVGGELEVTRYKPRHFVDEATMFNGKEWHRSHPIWEGERVSFVAFIHEAIDETSDEQKSEFLRLGFVLPEKKLV